MNTIIKIILILITILFLIVFPILYILNYYHKIEVPGIIKIMGCIGLVFDIAVIVGAIAAII